jgi:hypothetical protein
MDFFTTYGPLVGGAPRGGVGGWVHRGVDVLGWWVS